MPPETLNNFFSPVSTDIAHQNIDELIAINTLNDTGSMSAADPLWNKYLQGAEAVGDWTLEMFPPSPGVEKGTPEYEQAQKNIKSFFGLIPQEKWEIPFVALGAAGSAGNLAKKGLSKLHKTAKKIFGTTDDYNEAGWILDDGKMLDFSGKAEGGTAGRRAYDHRNINYVGDSELGGLDEFGNIGMDEFLAKGGVRVDGAFNSVNIATMPSKAQMERLEKFYKRYEDSPKKWYEQKNWDTNTSYFEEDEFTLFLLKPVSKALKDTPGGSEFGVRYAKSEPSWDELALDWTDMVTAKFTRDTPWEDVAKQIREVYREGKVEQSEVTKMIKHYRDLGKGG